MLTEQDLSRLIETPKAITAKDPVRGYREENNQIRCNLLLQTPFDESLVFQVFMRRHNRYIENFSIGLRYQTGDRHIGTVTLVRYNGAHGEAVLSPDGHFASPHIHYLTEAELAEGHVQPRELRRELTDRYGTFEEAIRIFLQDISVANWDSYFPELLQWSFLNGD